MAGKHYLGEFGTHWPNLLGACLGLGVGTAMNFFTMSVFGPALIADLGWERADYALIGSLPLLTMLLMPVAGRLCDYYGPRVAATVGFIVVPLAFFGMSRMSGNILEFFALNMLQNSFGILTTALVFCRVAVERFDTARGVALALVTVSPPVCGAIVTPFLGEIIANDGWRAGYVMLALISGIGGLLCILLIGPKLRGGTPTPERLRPSRQELLEIVRNPVFVPLFAGMLLVNLPQVFATSQLKLVGMDLGASDGFATWLVSIYAIGVVIGRLLSGLALDRFQPHRVALVILMLPAAGFLVLATGFSASVALLPAVLTIGFAQGAEGDIGAYLLSRRYEVRHFSLMLSSLNIMVGAGMVAGSMILSMTLRWTGGYTLFLYLCVAATIIGATLFGRSGGASRHLGTAPAAQAALRYKHFSAYWHRLKRPGAPK